MKLAEALIIRGDLQKRLGIMRNRLMNNAVVQEGEATAEDPSELLDETESLLEQLKDLITRINLTNAEIRADGKSLTGLLAERETLKMKISMYRSFLDSASNTGSRARGSEIKVRSSVSVSELQKKVDQLSKDLRHMEIYIQQLNFTTDLIE